MFPTRFGKRRHDELQVTVLPNGVVRYLLNRLERRGEAHELCFGVFRVVVDHMTAHMCVVELCREERYLGRDWARAQPTLYVAVDSGTGLERFLAEDWLATTSVADIVSGTVELVARIEEAARSGVPEHVRNVSVPVFRTGPGAIDASIGSVRRLGASPMREDGLYEPRTIVFRGTTHLCEMTMQEIAFLKAALTNAETPVDVLMHRERGAVWSETYSAAKRNKISQLLTRLNAKLLDATPPLRISFALGRGMQFVVRDDAPRAR